MLRSLHNRGAISRAALSLFLVSCIIAHCCVTAADATGTPKYQDTNVIMISIDTLRHDHLGCYGYHRNTSPHIDHIASEGITFKNYHCSDAPCLPSRTALTTGKFGIHTGVVGHGGTTADILIEGPTRDFKSRLEFETLPGILSSFGMKTVSISPFAARHGSWSFYAGSCLGPFRVRPG